MFLSMCFSPSYLTRVLWVGSFGCASLSLHFTELVYNGICTVCPCLFFCSAMCCYSLFTSCILSWLLSLQQQKFVVVRSLFWMNEFAKQNRKCNLSLLVQYTILVQFWLGNAWRLDLCLFLPCQLAFRLFFYCRFERIYEKSEISVVGYL